MSDTCMRYIVSGLVQGVGFRYHTCHEGLKRGLTGYAKNLDNGDVEIVASGDPQKLESLHVWLKEGPSSARVDRLITEGIAFRHFKGFDIEY